MGKKRILFIVNHRLGRSPGQRFRFEQYLDFLSDNNYEYEISNIIEEEDDEFLYDRGNYLKKAKLAQKAWKRRMEDVKRADQFDIIFVYREALLTGSYRFERQFAKSNAKLVFDFDDAIWLQNVSAGNRSLQFLKNPSKTQSILGVADMVFAGNDFLADFARKYADNVKVIPTTIDLNYHKRKSFRNDEKVCIGWTGTQTTLKYLDQIKPVFTELKRKYGNKIYFKVICDEPWDFNELEVINEKWLRENEIDQLEELDIGLMPLNDDQWSRGKCGFKGLQYMAMETATIMSPIGVNKQIVEHEINGYLANRKEDWLRIISLLIEDKELRRRIGKAGRKTISKYYSTSVYKEKYLEYFNEILN